MVSMSPIPPSQTIIVGTLVILLAGSAAFESMLAVRGVSLTAVRGVSLMAVRGSVTIDLLMAESLMIELVMVELLKLEAEGLIVAGGILMVGRGGPLGGPTAKVYTEEAGWRWHDGCWRWVVLAVGIIPRPIDV